MKRFEAIQEQADEMPVSLLCEVLQTLRSGYYAWCGREPSQRQQAHTVLTEKISEIFHDNRCCYGSPRIHAALQQAGYRIGCKCVARLMCQSGLRPRRRFGIECDYRQMRQMRVISSSRNLAAMKFFLLALSLILVNLWTALRWQLFRRHGLGPRTAPVDVFRLQRFIAMLRRAIAQSYQAVMVVSTTSSPQLVNY